MDSHDRFMELLEVLHGCRAVLQPVPGVLRGQGSKGLVSGGAMIVGKRAVVSRPRRQGQNGEVPDARLQEQDELN